MRKVLDNVSLLAHLSLYIFKCINIATTITLYTKTAELTKPVKLKVEALYENNELYHLFYKHVIAFQRTRV